MTYECFDVETTGRVAHLRMIRPERSQLDDPVVLARAARDRRRPVGLRARCARSSSPPRAGTSARAWTSRSSRATTRLGVEGGGSGHRSRRNEAFRSTAMKLQDTFTALERARMPVLCASRARASAAASTS